MASAAFPGWFSEICFRLESGDETLENLNLNIRRIDGNMMKALARAMTNSNLQKLNLTRAVVSNPAVSLRPLMIDALPVSNSLQVMHLSYNNIDCDDVRGMDLDLCLSTNTSLRELHLDYNSIGVVGAVTIARGLSNNNTLQVLQLDNNSIGNEGLEAIAQTLKNRSPLTILGLRSNRIGNHGIHSLRRSLEQSCNYRLQECLLSGNEVNVEEQEQEWVEMFCHANRIGRSVVANKGNFYLFPIVLARASEPSIPTTRSMSMLYLIIRNHLST